MTPPIPPTAVFNTGGGVYRPIPPRTKIKFDKKFPFNYDGKMKLKHLTIFFSLLAILTYVVLLPVKNINATETEEADVQRLFFKTFLGMTYGSLGLNHDMGIPEAILKLEDLIAQGANPNKNFGFPSEGEGGGLVTPISYIFTTCNNDFRTYYPDDRNFYLDIIKLLIDNGMDWNNTIYYQNDDGTSGSYSIADTIRWEEEEYATKPECLEVLAYVKTHLKENNIVIE